MSCGKCWKNRHSINNAVISSVSGFNYTVFCNKQNIIFTNRQNAIFTQSIQYLHKDKVGLYDIYRRNAAAQFFFIKKKQQKEYK